MGAYARTRNNEDGFTLHELALTVIIIGLTLGITLNIFQTNHREAREQAARETVMMNADIAEEALVNGITPDAAEKVATEDDIRSFIYAVGDTDYLACSYWVGSGRTVGFTYDSIRKEVYMDDCIRFDLLHDTSVARGLTDPSVPRPVANPLENPEA